MHLLALVVALALPAAARAAAPAAVITGGPSGAVASDTATFTFAASSPDGLASFQCSLDGGAWRACSSPVTYSGLAGGGHNFAVRLLGLFANARPDQRGWVVALDTQQLPPPLPPQKPPKHPRKPSSVRRDADGCAYAGNLVGDVSDSRLEKAVICELNWERAQHGLPSVRANSDLDVAAHQHARDMVARHYFDHYSPGGLGPVDRIRQTGYLANALYWAIGEVIAWTVRPAPTPHAALIAWMHSPPHRAVILTASYRDVGVGVVHGAPIRGFTGGGTFVADFGRRG